MQDTTDPDGPSIISAIVAEDNGKDHTTKIACCASEARKDAYSYELNEGNFRWSLQKWHWRTYH